MLRERGFQSAFFANDQVAANTDKLKSLEVAAGDSIFCPGFSHGPNGHTTKLCNSSPRGDCQDK